MTRARTSRVAHSRAAVKDSSGSAAARPTTWATMSSTTAGSIATAARRAGSIKMRRSASADGVASTNTSTWPRQPSMLSSTPAKSSRRVPTTRTGALAPSAAAARARGEALALGAVGAQRRHLLELIDHHQRAALAAFADRAQARGRVRLQARLPAVGGGDRVAQRGHRVPPRSQRQHGVAVLQATDHAGVDERRLADARAPDHRDHGRSHQPVGQGVDLALAPEEAAGVGHARRRQPGERALLVERVVQGVGVGRAERGQQQAGLLVVALVAPRRRRQPGRALAGLPQQEQLELGVWHRPLRPHQRGSGAGAMRPTSSSSTTSPTATASSHSSARGRVGWRTPIHTSAPCSPPTTRR
jgi:hypothetical protein